MVEQRYSGTVVKWYLVRITARDVVVEGRELRVGRGGRLEQQQLVMEYVRYVRVR